MDAFLFRVKAKRVWRNRQRTPNLQSPPSKTHTVINEDGLILYYSSKKKKKNEREISFCAFLSALAVSCVFCVCVVWRSGYNLFCKEQRGSMEGVPKRGYVSEWAQRWRDLTADERNRFSLRCATVCTLTLSTRTLLVNLMQGRSYARSCRWREITRWRWRNIVWWVIHERWNSWENDLEKKNNGVLNRNITGRGGNFQRIFLLQNRQHSASDHTGPTKKDTRPSVSLALHDKNCIFLFVFLIV